MTIVISLYVILTLRYQRSRPSMRRSVYVTVGCPSVCSIDNNYRLLIGICRRRQTAVARGVDPVFSGSGPTHFLR